MIAGEVIQLAKQDECDPERLSEQVLASWIGAIREGKTIFLELRHNGRRRSLWKREQSAPRRWEWALYLAAQSLRDEGAQPVAVGYRQ